MRKILNLPNVLTALRIFLLPVMMYGFFFDASQVRLVILLIFIFCCLTDFLDGYFARLNKQVTKFGQILDPIADKLLIVVMLLFIIGFVGMVSKYSIVPAAIIICREILISETRGVLSDRSVTLHVSYVAKWKTATQMIAIAVILSASLFPYRDEVSFLGEIMLWIASGLSVISAILYYKNNWNKIYEDED